MTNEEKQVFKAKALEQNDRIVGKWEISNSVTGPILEKEEDSSSGSSISSS